MEDGMAAEILARVRAARDTGDGHRLTVAFDAGMPRGVPVAGLAEAAMDCLEDDRGAVRNAAATALLDMRATHAAPALRAALRRPGVAAQGGTLVFVLVEMDACISPADAALLAAEGSYEARGELVELMRENRLDLSDLASLPGVMERLEDLADDCEDVGYAASEVLAALNRVGARARHALTC